MITMIVQIGNSDDKLTQSEWAKYCEVIDDYCYLWATAHKIHFHGHSPGGTPWQNAAWIFEFNIGQDGQRRKAFCDGLKLIAKQFRQDSIAVTEGITNFVG